MILMLMLIIQSYKDASLDMIRHNL